MGNRTGIVFFVLTVLTVLLVGTLTVAAFLFFHTTAESKIAELSTQIGVLENMLYETKVEVDEVQKAVQDVQESVVEIQNNVSAVQEVFQQAQNLQTYIARFQPRLRSKEVTEISYALLYYAQAHNLDPRLAAAVAEVESSFFPRAVSPKGAKGLMQLMPGTARMLGVHDSFNIHQNIAGGTRYLAMLYERFGDWRLALAAYHAGPGRVRAYRGIPPFRETRNFLSRVDRSYARLGESTR